MGEASSESVTEMPTATSDVLKARSKQSLAAIHSKEQSIEQQQGGLSTKMQSQVLNMANAESKGTTINQHKAAVTSTSSLMQDDLKMLDKELNKDAKPRQPAAAPAPKPEQKKAEEAKPAPPQPKKEEKPAEKKTDQAESWFSTSLSKFRSLKKKMFSALSFLPQTGSDSGEAPDDSENVQMTNQQKLGLFDTIVNEEEEEKL